MKFDELVKNALAIRQKYDELERDKLGESWNGEDLTLGFMGDVGDLAKLIAAKEGKRSIESVDDKLAHELADCLWSVIVLADKYGVDLEKAFVQTMDDLNQRFEDGTA